MSGEVTRWEMTRATKKWKRSGLWSIEESGVHFDNGQRIISEQGQRQFHYPLHHDLCICVHTCNCMHQGPSSWMSGHANVGAWSPLVHTSWYRQVVSQLHYLAHQLFFFPSSCNVKWIRPEREERLIRQPAWEADTTLKGALQRCVSNVCKIETIIRLIRVSNVITLLDLQQIHHMHAACAHLLSFSFSFRIHFPLSFTSRMLPRRLNVQQHVHVS